LRDEVRAKYAEAAAGGACSTDCGCGPGFYEGEAVGGILSLGCGNPVAVADLHEGETVLDLGSGGGLDVILSAERVGPTGIAWGLDMTEEMLALSRANAAERGVTNVHFLRGQIEHIPLPAESVDVVISNCVINLSTDKPAVFRELARVLKPGGRLGISDVVAEDRLTPDERAERGSYVGCIAGALSETEYLESLAEVGFEDVSIEFTYEAADGMHGAIVKGRKPAGTIASKPDRSLPVVGASSGPGGGCC
jgi:ubiquinone/menaquinone biosynthesis C-methylase UbiE